MCLSVCAFVSVCVCRGSMRVWVCMGMKVGVSISMVVGAAMGAPVLFDSLGLAGKKVPVCF